jgi:arylsulfatase A-like enzyme
MSGTFISRRKVLGMGIAGAAALAFGRMIQTGKSKKPNILFIMADDLPPGDLSCYFNKEYQTPVLDQLAREGVLFTDAYAATPVCLPTRCAFMTGRYPQKFTLGNKGSALEEGDTSSLPNDNLAVALKAAGYENVLVGKWHLGRKGPLESGFHEFFGMKFSISDYFSHKNIGKHPNLFDGNSPVEKEGYLTDLFTEKAIEVLSLPRQAPLFLSLQYNAPHSPIQGPNDKALSEELWKNASKISEIEFAKKFSKLGSRSSYVEMIKSLDASIGKVLNTLREKNMENETLVIFTSDNGGDTFGNLHHFKGGKGTVWEGGLRVPTIIRWPGRINAEQTVDSPVITMDLTATMIAAANAGQISEEPGDGIDLLPLLNEKKASLERDFCWRWRGARAIRRGNWKFVIDSSGERLFDIKNNPQENNNLASDNSDICRSLQAALQKWESTLLPAPKTDDPSFMNYYQQLEEKERSKPQNH